jgi:3-dehydroquinate synthase
MVDAAVGGKTGINFQGYKNIIGSFYPASTVYVFTETLATLSEREYFSGMAEVIKTALLDDRTLYAMLESEKLAIERRDPDLLREVIGRCIAVKGRYVEKDPREEGVRAHLNLGHTFAHALEAVAGLARWTHGEAVAWGMARAMDLGCRLGVTEPGYAERVKALLASYGFKLDKVGLDPGAVTAAMRKDKKRQQAALRFVLQRDLCETFVEEVEEGAARAVID